ncbi:hypothetical protein VNO77_19094 [Canavalia gladiata]|uniref:Uncharacterized protein n=1 Tax=Canavalia gladiata TaxID=3824 RepID=A0AAN9LRY3_CANGL
MLRADWGSGAREFSSFIANGLRSRLDFLLVVGGYAASVPYSKVRKARSGKFQQLGGLSRYGAKMLSGREGTYACIPNHKEFAFSGDIQVYQRISKGRILMRIFLPRGFKLVALPIWMPGRANHHGFMPYYSLSGKLDFRHMKREGILAKSPIFCMLDPFLLQPCEFTMNSCAVYARGFQFLSFLSPFLN